jgi:hypothetical protein
MLMRIPMSWGNLGAFLGGGKKKKEHLKPNEPEKKKGGWPW